MTFNRRFTPYVIVFFTVFIALIWRPFLIGFYGDDFTHTAAQTIDQALFYGRRERFFYFFPIAIPRYFFGHDQIGWGWYAMTVAGLTAMALYSFIKSILDRISATKAKAGTAAMAASILYIFMPWSLTPVLWNTALSQLVMVALLALAGTVLFSRLTVFPKTVLFLILFSVSSLIYETIWGAWIPLILLKLSLEDAPERKSTVTVAFVATLGQICLIANYLPSYGMEGRVMSSGGLHLSSKLFLFLENVFVRFPFEILSSMGVIGLIATPVFLYIVFWLYKHKSEFVNRPFVFALLSCLAGVLGGIMVVTLGNYRVSATTDDARFLSAVSIWLSLVVAMSISIILAKAPQNVRISSYVVYGLIVSAFFVRSNDWVQGYFFQRDAINAVPFQEIARLIDTQSNLENTTLLVEFDAPLHVFHGLDNTRGLQFISEKIKNETGKSVFPIAANGRMWKTVLNGTKLYQIRCANMNENVGGNYVVNNMIFWSFKTGELKKVFAPFNHGCTRTIHRFEFLGELLYPFMGNPRRP